MATADISKEACFDPRIMQNPARYAVDKGGLSYTNSPFNAISATASQHTYNINVPSQNVFLDRALNWTSTAFLQLNAVLDAVVSPFVAGQPVLKIGADIALTAFPLQSMIGTLQATINDTSVTINLDTVQKEVLRLVDFAANRKQRTCPTKLDRYQNYQDSYLAVNTPLASYLDATEDAEVPNGAYFNVAYTDAAGALLVGSGSYVSGATTVNFINAIPVRTAAAPGVDLAVYPIFIRFTSTEHLLLSPFIYADSYEYSTGLFGINNIQLVMNFKSGTDVGRVLRNSTTGGRTISSVTFNVNTATPFINSRVDCLFITPSLDIPLPAKSIVPYFEFPRYLTTGSDTILAGQTATLQSQTITLPQIPDMLVIYVKPQATQPNSVADFYLPITQCSVNFDNFSGLLASHSTAQLYQLSHHNGLMMDFNEWNGQGYSGETGGKIPLVGGFLVLRPGSDFALQPGQAPALNGNFTLQFNVTVLNQTAGSITNPVITTIAVNSGFFETLAGSSRIIKGVLNEADIISAPMASEGTKQELGRIVGSGFLSNLSNMLSKAKDVYTKVKPGSDVGRVVSAARAHMPAGVSKVLGDVGYGHAGYGQAGAGRAGAGRKKMLSERLM
jgi:hypothetical protein